MGLTGLEKRPYHYAAPRHRQRGESMVAGFF